MRVKKTFNKAEQVPTARLFLLTHMSTIIKSKLNTSFTTVPNEILQRPDLSAKAKGLFCYLMSLPNDWVIYKSEVVKHFKDGKDSINSAFGELEELGYLIGADQIKGDGKFEGKDYILYQFPFGKIPESVAENQTRPLRKTRHGTVAENPQLLNTNRQKKHIYIPTLIEVINYFTTNGYTKQSASKAFEYYNESVVGGGEKYWRDSKGNKVINWKQKMRANWFKEENRIKEAAPEINFTQNLYSQLRNGSS